MLFGEDGSAKDGSARSVGDGFPAARRHIIVPGDGLHSHNYADAMERQTQLHQDRVTAE